MDFIIDLSFANGNESIFVVVDRLTKMAHFIPCTKTIIGKDTTKLFPGNIYCIHGFPNTIVSNKGIQFISNFWKRLFQLLGVKINLYTAYHLQTDGQTERVNQIFEQYLCCTLNYQQDDWTDLLSLADFTYNNIMHSLIKQTPFFSNYGHHPRANPFQVKDVGSPVVEDLAAHLVAIYDELAFQLYGVQDCYKDYADCTWKIYSNFCIGDQAWLLQRNIKTKRLSRKLDYQRLDPFKILAQINLINYGLKFLPTMHLHLVFHVFY
jgi:hypothetical protein